MKSENKKKLQYFTDDMHKEIFPFQPALSTSRNSGGKPVVGTLKFNRTKSGNPNKFR